MSNNKLEELRLKVAGFAEKNVRPGASKRFQKFEFPREIFSKMGEAGITKTGFPREYGGDDTGCREFAVVMEEIARADSSAAVMLIPVYQVGRSILGFGSEEQKAAYLPPIIEGKKVGAFAVTETNAGSDVRALRTRAEKVNGGYLLNGKKAHITNAIDADIYIVFAQAGEGLSAFIVEKGTEGFQTGNRELSMGFRGGYHGELIFKDCFVKEGNLLGEEGQGLKIVLETLNYSRVGAASVSIGIARAALDEAILYARERELFGKRLIDFQGQRWRIAELLTKLEAAKLLRDQAAQKHDKREKVVKEASMAKLFCTRVATEVVLEAIQIVGSHGVMVNEAFQRYLLDAKSYEIAGGSSETLLNTIANFSLGK